MVTLCIKSILSRKEHLDKHVDVVVNLSTTQVAKDVTEEYGGHLHRTKVGEANVVEKMISVNAPIGGEGSGGVIYPPVGLFRDSLSGIALILELLAREDKKISAIVESLPKYIMKKENVTFKGDLNLLYRDLGAKFSDANVNNLDGLRFDWLDSSWIHIRPSNTEPLVRIFGEAKNEERINAIFKEAKLTLSVAESGVDFSLPKR
jgi:phosphomannomutase